MMKTHVAVRKFVISLLSLVLLVGVSLVVYPAGQAHAAGGGSVNNFLKAYTSKVHPRASYLGKAGVQFSCQLPTAQDRCYSPSQISKAYDYLPLYNKGIQGQGRTIVIMDFSQSPTIAQDLHKFDTLFGLPDPKLNVLAPFGADAPDPGIATEITLDVEWAHAVAPQATIDLLLVPGGNAQTVSDLYAAFLKGVSYAIDNQLGDAISMSYGFPELCINAQVAQLSHQVFKKAADQGITTIDSAGDSGATVPNCTFSDYFPFQATQFPAVESTVLDIGGTFLDTQASGAYKGETAWSQVSTNPSNGAGGGGFSTLYPVPHYQNGFFPTNSPSGRGIPDVAYNGDPRSGVIVLCSSCGAGSNALFVVGGTSAGAPQWAGIVALGSQLCGHALGFINPGLYELGKSSNYSSAFHDTVIGNNTFTYQNAKNNTVTVTGFSTRKGWDAVTGLGTPKVSHLLSLLVN